MSRMTTLEKKTRTSARRANGRASAAVSPVAADPVTPPCATPGPPATGQRLGWRRPDDWAAPRVETAVEWATPRVEPAVDKVRTEVLPAVAGAVATALAATEPARAEAANRGHRGAGRPQGRARAAAAQQAPGPQAVPADGAARGRLRGVPRLDGPQQRPGRRDQTGRRRPPRRWATSRSCGTPASDDPAGASPDEALADATEEPAPADDATTVTEAVSLEQAEKVSQAAAKGQGPQG